VQVVAARRGKANLQSAEQAADKIVRAIVAPRRGRDAGAFGAGRRRRDDQRVLREQLRRVALRQQHVDDPRREFV